MHDAIAIKLSTKKNQSLNFNLRIQNPVNINVYFTEICKTFRILM